MTTQLWAGPPLTAAPGCSTGPLGGLAAAGAVDAGARPGELLVAILLHPDMTGLDAVGPYEVPARLPVPRVMFGGERAGPVLTDTEALQVVAEHELEAVATPDVLVVPGGRVVAAVAPTVCGRQDRLTNSPATRTPASVPLLNARTLPATTRLPASRRPLRPPRADGPGPWTATPQPPRDR